MKELYKQNVDKIDLDNVLDSTCEECAELIQACNKFKRANGHGLPTNRTFEEAKNMIIEELGDVMRCCDMVIYKMGIDIQMILRNQIMSDQKIADRFEERSRKEGNNG